MWSWWLNAVISIAVRSARAIALSVERSALQESSLMLVTKVHVVSVPYMSTSAQIQWFYKTSDPDSTQFLFFFYYSRIFIRIWISIFALRIRTRPKVVEIGHRLVKGHVLVSVHTDRFVQSQIEVFSSNRKKVKIYRLNFTVINLHE